MNRKILLQLTYEVMVHLFLREEWPFGACLFCRHRLQISATAIAVATFSIGSMSLTRSTAL